MRLLPQPLLAATAPPGSSGLSHCFLGRWRLERLPTGGKTASAALGGLHSRIHEAAERRHIILAL